MGIATPLSRFGLTHPRPAVLVGSSRGSDCGGGRTALAAGLRVTLEMPPRLPKRDTEALESLPVSGKLGGPFMTLGGNPEMSNDLQSRTEQRARHIWEREGRPDGRAEEHWRLAAEEISREDEQAAAKKAAKEKAAEEAAAKEKAAEEAAAKKKAAEEAAAKEKAAEEAAAKEKAAKETAAKKKAAEEAAAKETAAKKKPAAKAASPQAKKPSTKKKG